MTTGSILAKADTSFKARETEKNPVLSEEFLGAEQNGDGWGSLLAYFTSVSQFRIFMILKSYLL